MQGVRSLVSKGEEQQQREVLMVVESLVKMWDHREKMLEAQTEETLIRCNGRKGTKQTSLSGFVELMITADVFFLITAEKQRLSAGELQQGSVHTELNATSAS